MPTPHELRAAIAAGRTEFRAALQSATDKWERRPTGNASGEDAWSPRQVAEHVIPAELYFATEVCKACGYPGLDLARGSYPDVADALAALEEFAAKADGRLKYVSEKDTAMAHERMGTVAGVMQVHASHLLDHATQVRNA